jgi:hypothetical protein
MNNGSPIAVECLIARSGFSSERIFTITLPDGSRHVGASPVDYFRDFNGKPLDAETPARDEEIPGLLTARVLQRDNDKRQIFVPGGDVLWVPESILKSKENSDVPAQS